MKKHLLLVYFSFTILLTFGQNNIITDTTNEPISFPRLGINQRLAMELPRDYTIVVDTDKRGFYMYKSAGYFKWDCIYEWPYIPSLRPIAKVFISSGSCTLISSNVPTAVNGLKQTITLTDSSYVFVYTEGVLSGDEQEDIIFKTSTLLFQNSKPINSMTSELTTAPSRHIITKMTNSFSCLTFLNLPPGTYVFEVKLSLIQGKPYYASCDDKNNNNGILKVGIINKH